MKGHGSDKRAPSVNPLVGVRAVLIRKNSPEALILRRIREYLLFSKLRSLVPPPLELETPPRNPSSSEGVMEYEPARDEIPIGDSDEENVEISTDLQTTSIHDNESDYPEDEVVFEDEDEIDDTGAEKPFVPSIKIKKMDDALFISTTVLKDVALTSALFHILEEEKLDILYENQYRTETKVAHTIQVRVGAEYDADALEKKLCIWAGKPLEPVYPINVDS